MSDDDFDSAFLECLRDEGGGQDRVDEFLEKIPKSPEYDAFQLKMGQMTVYRYFEQKKPNKIRNILNSSWELS